MKFIIKVNDKAVCTINSQYKDAKKGYINAQELINKFLNTKDIENYKMVLEH